MAQYRLLAEHVTSDSRVLPAGTVVGDGTPEPWGEPSGQMDPLDADALANVRKFHVDRYGEEGWENFKRAMEARKVPHDEPEEVKGPPVSKAQAEERGEKWEEEEKVKPPFTGPAAAPASPQVRPRVESPREHPISPNKDQYPKDG